MKNLYKQYLKRCFDCTIACIAIVCLAPVLLILACLVRRFLGHPVFFKQIRPGLYGKPFELIKFRTMSNAKGIDGKLLPDTERLTPFGKWLRRTSLDELPELWNVLTGDMSLVGPRPLLMEYLNEYTEEQHTRHNVRPGLTGLAQVRGRNSLSWEEKFRYDLDYVNNISFFSDIKIICSTVAVIFSAHGVSADTGETPDPYRNPRQETESNRFETETARRDDQEVVQKESSEAWPSFSAGEIEAVVSVLKSGRVNYWTGNEIGQFEKEFSRYCEIEHAIAVANGTVAIELALRSLGIGAGDEVIVPSRTFVATASAVVACGAEPVFADICLHTGGISSSTVEKVITKKTRAIIAVHLGGTPVEIKGLVNYAKSRGLFVVEDCSQAHGATVDGQMVGTFGNVGTFSFCQDKIMTTAGEGGMVITNDQKIAETIWSYKDHGKSFQTRQRLPGDGTFKFVHDICGTNLRMSELHAAVGRHQLRALPSWVKARRDNAKAIAVGLSKEKALIFYPEPDNVHGSFYRLYAFIDSSSLAPNWNRDRIVRELVAEGTPVGIGSCGVVYKEKAFQRSRSQTFCPNAEYAHNQSLAFLVHPTLRQATINRTIERTVAKLNEARDHRSAA